MFDVSFAFRRKIDGFFSDLKVEMRLRSLTVVGSASMDVMAAKGLAAGFRPAAAA